MIPRFRKLIAAGLVALAVSGAGCRLPGRSSDSLAIAEQREAAATEITYSTGSDRLNVAGASIAPQFAAYGATSTSLLPDVTKSQLQLRHPHPSGRLDLAQATLTVYYEVDGENESLLASSSGDASLSGTGSQSIVGRWTLNIPAWQMAGIRDRLQKENFFRRACVLGAEADLSVAEGGNVFAKPYHAVPELDAVLLRTAREGVPSQFASQHQTAGQPPHAMPEQLQR